ncbi:MAG: hypothetical protein ACT4OT_04350 [Acidobacteriota bacterium]
MKKLVVTLFVVLFFSGLAFSQPTLTIVTETPGLPSELFYGTVKVKPVRMRPPGATLNPPFWCIGAANTAITIDDCDFFVQQQYIDFLKRFPEAGPDNTYGTTDDPLRFYMNIIAGCAPSDVECVKYSRGAVSANFFRSPEFQRKGNYVMYLYMVSIGQRPVTAAELPTKNDPALNDRPLYPEFMTDLASISTPNDDPALTETLKNNLATNWLTRPQIAGIYGGLTNANFVQKLIDVSGVTPANQTWVADLNAATKTRAQVLRLFAESPEVDAKFFKQSFVTMEYFGYLRRKPEDCHDQANWGPNGAADCGYIFHNARFNLHPDPDFIQNTIVRGFIESPEYRGRF